MAGITAALVEGTVTGTDMAGTVPHPLRQTHPSVPRAQVR